MRILAIERERPTPFHTNLHDLLRDEAAAILDLQKREIIRDLWFTGSERHAVMILECTNGAEARKYLATLPLVLTGLIDFTVHELRHYDGFERLLATTAEPVAIKPEEPAEY